MKRRTTGAGGARTIRYAWLTVLVLVCALCSVPRAAACTAHEQVLQADLRHITQSGKYYLDGNLTLAGGLTIDAGADVTLCLNGWQLTASGGSAVLTVETGATLHLCDCYDAQTHPGEAYQHSYRAAGTLRSNTVSGGLIYGQNTRVGVEVRGTLYVQSGTIAGCRGQSGAGIYVNSGTLHMEGGSIRHNYAEANGGGIATRAGGGQIILEDGEIADNIAEESGGGVYIAKRSEMTMTGGSVLRNAQSEQSTLNTYGGGGIYVAYSAATLNLYGGTIRGNTAVTKGAGVFVAHTTSRYTTTMCLKGEPVVTENLCGDEEQNLYLNINNGKYSVITIEGALRGAADIGVTYPGTLDAPLALILPQEGYSCTETDAQHLFSDDASRSLALLEGQLVLCDGALTPICGELCTHTQQHEKVAFFRMPRNFTGGTLAGSYYLDEDVTLTTAIRVEENTTLNLCLNGAVLKNANGAVLEVAEGATLNLSDWESEQTRTFLHGRTQTELTAAGGLVQGSIVVSGGTLHLFGGTVGGAQTAGVQVTQSGSVSMWDGTITGCASQTHGGGILADETATVTLRGGSIQRNYAQEEGGGVYCAGTLCLSGDVCVTRNQTQLHTSNVYLPAGKTLRVTGTLRGTVGIAMEETGVFTSGGAADSVSAWTADAAGTFLRTVGTELCVEAYGVQTQPTPDSPTVVMRHAADVQAYQWYALQMGSGQTLSATVENGTAVLAEVQLNAGDTLKIEPQGQSRGVVLAERKRAALTPDLTEEVFWEVCTEDRAADAAGAYFVTAPRDGTYALRLLTEEQSAAAVVTRFSCGAALTTQKTATCMNAENWYLCRVEYKNGTVVYSEPVRPKPHSHSLCGSSCGHEAAHGTQTFVPFAADSDGALYAGETALSSNVLPAGQYVLAADLTLQTGLTIASGRVVLCLNGQTLCAEHGSALNVAAGAELILCDCKGSGSVYGTDVAQGGAIHLSGDATLFSVKLCSSVAENAVYVNQNATLTLSGAVRIAENETQSGVAANLYLADGSTLAVTETEPSLKIGLAMQTPGQFLTNAAEALVDNFSSDRTGYFICAEEGNLHLRAFAILEQPTQQTRTVTVNAPELVAGYQWYAVEEEAVEAERAAEDGTYFTQTLNENQQICIQMRGTLPEGAALALCDAGGTEVPLRLREETQTAYWGTIPADDTYTLKLVLAQPQTDALPAIQAVVYTTGAALTDQTEQTLHAGAGAYVCRVEYEDGTLLESELLVIPQTVSGTTKAPQTAALPYTDVAETDWFCEAVQTVSAAGLMTGTGKTTFSPNAQTTRAMVVTILWRLAGKPGASQESPFHDVPADDYYAQAVAWAAEQKIVHGTTKATFSPDAAVTREQLAAMLYRYAQAYPTGWDLSATAALEQYTDQPAGWAVEAMRWAVGSKVMKGRGSTRLAPQAHTTRAELATILMRILN